ncbi:YfiR family protein [Nitrincola sp.]|uniref:YfiR family protein n=1 Tax=Nitrincola sp. TaxID=1926584 RepID=UPI003A8D061D
MRFLIFLALISVVFLAPDLVRAASSSDIDADREQKTGQQVSYIVSGIVSYSRWPEDIAPSKACVVGSTLYRQALFDQGMNRNSYTWHHYQESDHWDVESCDILYIGLLNSSDRDSLLSGIIGKPVLSISEQDPHCDGGSLICLNLVEGGSSFQVNLDAVARSGIRIHPQVLKLGRELRPN